MKGEPKMRDDEATAVAKAFRADIVGCPERPRDEKAHDGND